MIMNNDQVNRHVDLRFTIKQHPLVYETGLNPSKAWILRSSSNVKEAILKHFLQAILAYRGREGKRHKRLRLDWSWRPVKVV